MKKIKYQFVDGKVKSVEVSDALYEEYAKMELQMISNERRETRRHVSLEYLMDKGMDFAQEEILLPEDIEGFGYGDLADAVKELSEDQRKLLYLYFIDRYTPAELAAMEGVDKHAIIMRLSRIYKKLKKSFRKCVTFCPFSWL